MVNQTTIIAEAGVNHNGDIRIAKRLIDIAADAGADYVKFQTFSADRIVTQSAAKALYQQHSTDASETQYKMLKKLELSIEMHQELIERCKQKSIKFLSTGFDIGSLNLLVNLGQKLVKIPSGEITNLPLLRFAGSLQLPIILSSGMSTMDEIGDSLAILEQAGMSRTQISVLHCTSEYPTPMEEVNLRAMKSIQINYGVAVGYSDHTVGIEVSIAAVALGASIIEKHFTIDRALPGPDHRASLEPADLAAMVAAIRNVEKSLGSEIKEPTNGELRNRNESRKSIRAGKFIRKGEIYTETNLIVKRPSDGVSPMLWDKMIGQRANRDYVPDEKID